VIPTWAIIVGGVFVICGIASGVLLWTSHHGYDTPATPEMKEWVRRARELMKEKDAR
jgi:hypothetical protein